jgi:hypothetical protein
MGKSKIISKKDIKSKNKISKSKINKAKINKNNKRTIKKKKPNEDEYITDLSFIDKYEEEEKNRIFQIEEQDLIKSRNKKLYKLKICYRPLKNSIELIGKCYEKDDDIKDILLNENSNQCCYILNKDNNIIVPIAINEILKDGKTKHQKKTSEKYGNSKKDSFLYLHICNKNLINCILLNENYIINYINIFLSGNYSGFFEEIKNDKKILKVDNFDIFLIKNIFEDKNEYYNFEVIGKGKDEYGEYIIKGKINLIKEIEQFKKENIFKNTKNVNNKVINFGEMTFKKIYDI